MNNSLLIGKGNGISRFLSSKLGISSIPSSELKNIDLSKFTKIIYTSTDPSHLLKKDEMRNYLNKNIINIYRLLESKFTGEIIYFSSIDSGAYKVRKEENRNEIEEMYTPYSFSKYIAESLFLSHKKLESCTVLRLGLLWPTKENSNLFHALHSKPEKIKLNLNSSYYLTPYSLILNFIKKNIMKNSKFENRIGYLASSNKFTLSNILNLRNINHKLVMDNNYLYQTKTMDNEIDNFIEGNWFNWEKESDYNSLIAKALKTNGYEKILPNRI